MKNLLVLALFATLLTSCYKMPGDDDYSLIPTTNNPNVTCEKSSQMIPSCKY
jgi:hypothetical protein